MKTLRILLTLAIGVGAWAQTPDAFVLKGGTVQHHFRSCD